VTLPDGFDQFMVSKDGRVSIVNKGDTAPTEVGQIQLVSFSNASGLEAMGGNLFQKTPASGEPTIGPPGSQGVGFLLSGFTETSNVQMVEEMVEMISAQRAYESNSRVVKAADDMLRTAAQIK
jgi:flagellar basal-body rod protein FlgG